MPRSSFNREDYKTVIPQLEKRIKEQAEDIKELKDKIGQLEKRVEELENNNA